MRLAQSFLSVVVLLVAVLASAPAAAQSYRYSVFIDSDGDAATGCVVATAAGGVTGVEARLTATVDPDPVGVEQMTLAFCEGGVFATATTVGGGHAVGFDRVSGEFDVVELAVDIGALGGDVGSDWSLWYLSESPLLGAVDLAGPVQVDGIGVPGTPPPLPQPNVVPAAGELTLLLLCIAIAAAALWFIRRNPGLAVLILLGGAVSIGGVAWAANYLLDGEIGDWDVAPVLTDAIGDATEDEPQVDIVQVFAAREGGRVFFRFDLVETVLGILLPPLIDTEFDVDENSANGTVVGSMRASAAGLGSLLRFDLTAPAPAAAFAVDQDSGDISVADTTLLDFETSPAFTLQVDVGLSVLPGFALPVEADIAVNDVNEAPLVEPQAYTVFENAADGDGVGTVLANDVDAGANGALSFSIAGGTGAAIFSIDGSSGEISVADAAAIDISATPYTLEVEVSDGGTPALSTTATMTINVDDVNDAPSFTGGGDVDVLEDGGAYAAVWATAISDGDNETQGLQFNVTANSNAALFSIAPAINATSGQLSFVPAADANGFADVTVELQDDGGTASGGVDTSAPQTFRIDVTPVNDAPGFAAADPAAVLEDSGAAVVNGWASFTSGPPNESGQIVQGYTVAVSANPALFAVAPAVDAAGNLSYTPAADAFGSATIAVTVQDDGGTANGGVDTSVPQSFQIVVSAVNDAPAFTAADPPASVEDQGPVTINGWVASFDPGPAEAGQGVAEYLVSVTANPGLFSTAPTVDAAGNLSYTSGPDAFGVAAIEVRVRDDGGTADGGIDLSPVQSFTITVTDVIDAPILDLNGPAAGSGFSAAYVEGDAPVAIVDSAELTLVDIDSTEIAQALISIGNLQDGASEALAVDVSGTPITQAYNAALGTLTLSGLATVSDYRNVLRTTTYVNGSSNPGETTRNVGFVVEDAEGAVSDAVLAEVTVTGINSAPTFDAGGDVGVDEDSGAYAAGWATNIADGDGGGQTLAFVVDGNDNAALFATQPAISATGELSFTLADDANGVANIDVFLSDDGGTANGGTDASPIVSFQITVNPVNDAPVVDLNGPAAGTGFAAAFEEAGGAVAIVDAAALTVSDIDSSVISVATVTITNLIDAGDEVLAFDTTGTPVVAAYDAVTGVLDLQGPGTLAEFQQVLRTVTYQNQSTDPTESVRLIDFVVSDDEPLASDIATSSVSVTAVNTAPSFTPGGDPTVLEDSGAYNQPWATALNDGDGGGQTLSFNVTGNTNTALFAAGPTVDGVSGNLAFAPAVDANGSADITVELTDSAGGDDTSAAVTFTITVTPVNDAPEFSVPAAAPSVLENSGAQSVAGFATGIAAGPTDESGQGLSFSTVVTDLQGSLTFSVAPAISATGTLSYTPAADTSGTATVEVLLEDDGGTADGGVDTSITQTFTIEVDGVNSAPTFAAGGDIGVDEDSGAYSATWATALDDGDLDEVQTLSFAVSGNTNTALFASAPVLTVVGTDGVLAFTPANDANGSADITVVLSDNGGTANGGVDAANPVTFTVTVGAVNDAPNFDMPATAPAVNEDAGAQTLVGFATNIDTGPANESGQTLLGFSIAQNSIDPTLSFASAPAISSDGTLSYAAAADAYGSATYTVTLQDDGGTANGGVDSRSRNLSISISPINDVPAFAGGATVNVLEDSGSYSALWATAVSAGANESGQSLTFALSGNTNPSLFSVAPAIAANGTLSFTPAANAFGSATLSVILSDDGGTANGGVDTSVAQALTINVTAVNDPPVVVAPTAVAVHRHIGITIPALNPANLLANVSDVDGPGAEPFTLTVVSDAATTGGGTFSTAADGSWTYQPPASNTLDSDSFSYEVCDSGVPLPPVCTNAVATITLSGPAIWFVDAGAAAGGTGTLARPFQTLAAAAVAAGTNARIFKYSGNHTGGATLLDGQQLIGQGATAASFDVLFGITPPVHAVARPAVNGTRPLVTTAGVGIHGITLGSGNTVRGIEIGATSGSALHGTSVGALSLGENRISGAGQALNLASGTITQVGPGNAFDQITSTSGVSNIALNAIAGTANFGTGSLSGATGTSFAFSTGTATITYAGTINKTTAGRLIDIDGAGAANLTLSGNLSCTGTCGSGAGNAGIRINARTGSGSYVFSGGTKDLTGSGASHGVSLTSNSAGSAIRFDNGGLAVATTTGTAFHASGGGTVSVSAGATPNTLAATSGIALNFVDTTIAAADLNFRSISAAGAASGIVLNNTGSAGSLFVAGNGGSCTGAANCTGGAIQNTSSHGVWLQGTTEPTLTRMFINNAAAHGVGGTEVNGFSLTNSVISNTGGDGVARRANIGFNVVAAGTERNLYGAVTITGNTLTNSRGFGVELFNYNGTISSADISGNTLTSSISAATSNGWAVSLIAYGSAATVANVTRANIDNNVISNFPGGGGIQAMGGNANAAGAAGTFGVAGHATNLISIRGNRIAGASPGNRMNAEGIVAAVNGLGQGNFDISNNGTVANPLTNITGTGISHSAFGAAVVTSIINNNVIVANNSFASPGIGGGLGFTFSVADAPQMTTTVSNNSISQTEGNGILLVARDTNGTLRARVLDNIVAAPVAGVRQGIRIDSGNGGVGENDTVCLNIAGNTSSPSVGFPAALGIGLRKQGIDPNLFRFSVNGMAATSTPAVETYVDGLNPAGSGTLLISASSGFTSCALP